LGALALTFALFLFWSLVGFSLVSLLNRRKNVTRNVLLSPVVGAAATALLVSWLN
jgi:hypothetical protein